MKVNCVWEHNGDDTILYSSNFVGAFTRGKSRSEAIQKMPSEIMSYLKWKGDLISDILEPEIIQEKASELTISDAQAVDKLGVGRHAQHHFSLNIDLFPVLIPKYK